MENLFNDELETSSSDNETNGGSDNEFDNDPSNKAI